MTKKKVDFSVRPRAAKVELPADPEQWVQAGEGAVADKEKPRGGREKRLTLNLPAALHTAFKGRCVLEGVTIQDKVHELIDQELQKPLPASRQGDSAL